MPHFLNSIVYLQGHLLGVSYRREIINEECSSLQPLNIIDIKLLFEDILDNIQKRHSWWGASHQI